MNDHRFLRWVYDRLEYVYDEDPRADHMRRLRAIISEIPADQKTLPPEGSDPYTGSFRDLTGTVVIRTEEDT